MPARSRPRTPSSTVSRPPRSCRTSSRLSLPYPLPPFLSQKRRTLLCLGERAVDRIVVGCLDQLAHEHLDALLGIAQALLQRRQKRHAARILLEALLEFERVRFEQAD